MPMLDKIKGGVRKPAVAVLYELGRRRLNKNVAYICALEPLKQLVSLV